MHTTQPCRIFLHPAVLTNPDTINAIVARTGLAVVVGDNRAAPSLVQRKAPKRLEKSRFLSELRAAFKHTEVIHNRDPGNGGWIGDDPDPFNGGGKAA